MAEPIHRVQSIRPPVTPQPRMDQPRNLQSTPIAFKVAGSHANAHEVKKREKMNLELAEEMKGHFVGPMPVQAFLDEFLPSTSRRKLNISFKPWSPPVLESDMYDQFIQAVSPSLSAMTLLKTYRSPDAAADKLAPDISVYHNKNSPFGTNTDFSRMSTFVEFKLSVADDPFVDPGLEHDKETFCFERDTEEHMKRRGQIGSYSAALSGSQFRVHVFSVSICGDTARFIRWDRSGAIVTRSFNYVDDPKLLAEFFWRYSRAEPRIQGYDDAVRSTTSKEERAAKEAFFTSGRRKYVYKNFRKIMVPNRDDPRTEKGFIIPFPLPYECRSPFSRATRPMYAYDLSSKKLVFLKEYWRPNAEGFDKEGDIYAILHQHGVSNIAPFGTGNDVRDHVTRAQEFVKEDWAVQSPDNVKLVSRSQYRMTLDVIGKPLHEFGSSKQFVSAIRDAMKAHDDAFFKAEILHRDISVGNIIIIIEPDGQSRGLLVDWDMCIKVKNMTNGPRRHNRTGTWQFISARLLQDGSHFHGIEDDRESALYVLLWTALRYTKHSETGSKGTRRAAIIKAFDEAYTDMSGEVIGGELKARFLMAPSRLRFDSRPELDALVADLCKTFAFQYNMVPTEEEIQEIRQLLEKHKEQAKFIRRDPVYRYVECTEKLAKQGWLVDTFTKYLEKGDWPNDDEAEEQKIVVGQPTTGHKRTLDQVNLSERVKKVKTAR